MTLLQVQDLCVEFRTRLGRVQALDRISFSLAAGETLGIVGESGSGKSVTAFSLMQVLESSGHITGGKALFQVGSKSVDLFQESEASLRQLRGKALSMIFQNPRTALNPIRSVGKQIRDVLRCHTSLSRSQIHERVLELLTQVRIPDPEQRYHAYPYELSGGLCQRIMIALALACSPKLLIADEPTTGLDVTTQTAILNLIRDLTQAQSMALILITHDLALASEYCDRILVMHAGHTVEEAPTHQLFQNPAHPYTQRLIAATPEPHKTLLDLQPIPGALPDLRNPNLPPCRFQTRCDRYEPGLCDQTPLLHQHLSPQHSVACWKPLQPPFTVPQPHDQST
ncbi:MAG: ABC transporter ATP-binding protein [Prochlorotrichaceae cyanobacterium]